MHLVLHHFDRSCKYYISCFLYFTWNWTLLSAYVYLTEGWHTSYSVMLSQVRSKHKAQTKKERPHRLMERRVFEAITKPIHPVTCIDQSSCLGKGLQQVQDEVNRTSLSSAHVTSFTFLGIHILCFSLKWLYQGHLLTHILLIP